MPPKSLAKLFSFVVLNCYYNIGAAKTGNLN